MMTRQRLTEGLRLLGRKPRIRFHLEGLQKELLLSVVHFQKQSQSYLSRVEYIVCRQYYLAKGFWKDHLSCLVYSRAPKLDFLHYNLHTLSPVIPVMSTSACATASLLPVWRNLLVIEVFVSIPYAPNHGNEIRRRVARALYASGFDVGRRPLVLQACSLACSMIAGPS